MVDSFKVNEIIGGDLKAVSDASLFSGVSSPHDSTCNDVVFLFDKSYEISQIKAKLIVAKEFQDEFKFNQIRHENPRLAMAKLLSFFYPASNQDLDHQIDDSVILCENVSLTEPLCISGFTKVGANSSIDKHTYIGPNVSIGSNCKIGKNCIINAQVSIYDNTVIGDNVIIHSNTSVGADGFGYEKENGKWRKIPQIGGVIIEDDVEIGSQSAIDSGCLSPTIIRSGVKIDNHVQISHNCEIKDDTVIVSGTLIGGSTTVGKRCILAGNVNLSDNIIVGDDVTILARAGVTKNIESNQVISGYPAIPHKEEIRFQAFLKRLFKTKN